MTDFSPAADLPVLNFPVTDLLAHDRKRQIKASLSNYSPGKHRCNVISAKEVPYGW